VLAAERSRERHHNLAVHMPTRHFFSAAASLAQSAGAVPVDGGAAVAAGTGSQANCACSSGAPGPAGIRWGWTAATLLCCGRAKMSTVAHGTQTFSHMRRTWTETCRCAVRFTMRDAAIHPLAELVLERQGQHARRAVRMQQERLNANRRERRLWPGGTLWHHSVVQARAAAARTGAPSAFGRDCARTLHRWPDAYA
jgi:hypothetical protein